MKTVSNSSLIDILPGIPMSVDDVSSTLARMWDSEHREGVEPQSDFRASQMNLILHFGLKTSDEEALATFNHAIQFAQDYPCRIVVLCPSTEAKGESILEGKLYSQCFIGSNLRDLCCCEALILGYSIEESNFLENQVSLWLESDLPTYHWFHRVPADRINAFYLPFMKRCRRILFDTAMEGVKKLEVFWPDGTRLSDLAYARTLPFRQQMGQFLSSFSPEHLTNQLETIEFRYSSKYAYEVAHLVNWHCAALRDCLSLEADEALPIELLEVQIEDGKSQIEIDWKYTQPKKFLTWCYQAEAKAGCFKSNLDHGTNEHYTHIERLSSSKELAEAMFF